MDQRTNFTLLMKKFSDGVHNLEINESKFDLSIINNYIGAYRNGIMHLMQNNSFPDNLRESANDLLKRLDKLSQAKTGFKDVIENYAQKITNLESNISTMNVEMAEHMIEECRNGLNSLLQNPTFPESLKARANEQLIKINDLSKRKIIHSNEIDEDR